MNVELFSGFNALTSPWLPLARAGERPAWASPLEVLCGEKDGDDLVYPRDDFRVYARLLLSALVQALFPPADREELRRRMETPLSRAEFEARIHAVRPDFDLFGPTPFLQVAPPPGNRPDKGAAPFVFGSYDLYQPAVAPELISLPIALVTLFAEQTYAGGAGRGYGAGPGGQPGVFTLLDVRSSLRRSAWANTLNTQDLSRFNCNKDGERPWNNAKRAARPRGSIGLVEGLFFQPRSIWLIPNGEGYCSITGEQGPLVRLSPFLPKSELAKKASDGDDLWIHPCAPMTSNSQGLGPIRLNAERPAWTGLAQVLSPVSKEPRSKRRRHPLQGPAMVITQWKHLPRSEGPVRMILLDFDRDKAIVRRRFFEAFSLADDLLDDEETIERVREVVNCAEDVERRLLFALSEAHDDRKAGGFSLSDARTEFWTATEKPFHDWLASVGGPDQPAEDRIASARSHLLQMMLRSAVSIFDSHVEISEFDPRKQEQIAKARKRLRSYLHYRMGNPAPRTEEAVS